MSLSAKTPPLDTSITNLPAAIPASPNPLIADFGAIGSLMSGITAIWALLKAKNSEEQAKMIKSATAHVVHEVFNELIQKAESESERKRLLENQQLLEEQFQDLHNRADASRKAQKWLKNHRENSLVDEAVEYALKNQTVRGDVRKEFRLHINQYLYIIQECLNPEIGRFNLIDKILEELKNKHQLPRQYYEDALRFVVENEATTKLSGDAVAEMKIYFKYLVDNLP